MTPTIAPPSSPEPFTPHSARTRHLSSVGNDPDPWMYVAVLRKRIRWLIALPIVFAGFAGGSNLLRPRMFLAKAAFIASEPASASGSLSALSSIASQLGIPGLSAVASSTASGSAQFYGDLLTSNAMLDALVTTRYDASADVPYGGKPFAGTLLEYGSSTSKTATDRKIDAMNRASHSMLKVSVDRPTGIVRFSVRTKNRQLSALIARRLLDLVNDFNLRRRQTQAGAEKEFDAKRTQAALDTLRVAEQALADFRAGNIDFSRSPRLATRESELQRRVTMAQQIYTTIAQRYEVANIEAVRNTPVVTVLDAPEGLVMSEPRYTVLVTVGAFFVGLIVAIVAALSAERLASTKTTAAVASGASGSIAAAR